MISPSQPTSTVSLVSRGLGGACLGLGDTNSFESRSQWLKRLAEWVNEAPTGENRQQVASELDYFSKCNETQFFIENSSITKIPPLPRSITVLHLRDCRNLENLEGDVSHLLELNVAFCQNIKTWPDNLVNLTKLVVEDCNSFEKLPDNLVNLVELVMQGCSDSFQKLPENLPQLAFLQLSGCTWLKELPTNYLSLKSVYIGRCHNLTIWSGNSPLLEKASIHDCRHLTTWSCSTPKLASLNIYLNKLTVFPDDLPVNLTITGIGVPPKEVLYASQIKRDQRTLQEIVSKISHELPGPERRDLIGATEPLTYQQRYPLSCGAASLFFIARDLGLKKFPAVAEAFQAFPLLSHTHPCYKEDGSLEFFREKDVYKITSDYDGDMAEISKARGSWPHNIILAAKELGLAAEVYVETNQYNLYHPTKLYVKTVLFFHLINTNEEKPQLNDNELEMKLLAYVDSSGNPIPGKWDEIYHWVVCRPDGTLMDPGTGRNFNSLVDLNMGANKERQVVDSGMTIVLKHPLKSESSCNLF